MLLKCVDALTGETIFDCEGIAGMPLPEAGDIFVAPTGMQYRVLQRALICCELKSNRIVQLDAQKALDFELQCACCPAGKEEEYRSQSEEI